MTDRRDTKLLVCKLQSFEVNSFAIQRKRAVISAKSGFSAMDHVKSERLLINIKAVNDTIVRSSEEQLS